MWPDQRIYKSDWCRIKPQEREQLPHVGNVLAKDQNVGKTGKSLITEYSDYFSIVYQAKWLDSFENQNTKSLKLWFSVAGFFWKTRARMKCSKKAFCCLLPNKPIFLQSQVCCQVKTMNSSGCILSKTEKPRRLKFGFQWLYFFLKTPEECTFCPTKHQHKLSKFQPLRNAPFQDHLSKSHLLSSKPA